MPDLRPDDVRDFAGVDLVRIHRARGRHTVGWQEFRHVGPLPTMRFDHQEGPTRLDPQRGVLYAVAGTAVSACDPLDVAVLEVFGMTGVVPLSEGSHWLAIARPARSLRLLDLSDSTWVARAGGNTALTSGARSMSRRWAAAIWSAYPQVDGLLWSSSRLPAGRCVAIFERGASALPAHPDLHLPLDHPGLRPALGRIATDYGLVLA